MAENDPKGYLAKDYEELEFTVNDAVTNFDVKASVTGAFTKIDYPRELTIRSDQPLTVRFNDVGNDPITLPLEDLPFNINTIRIENLFISNSSGSVANIKILMAL